MATNTITLRQIEHFLVLAEELNFSRAAQRCSIAQPPFSRSIQRLEAALQAPLIERRPRGAELTESGRVFADESRTALAALRHAAEHARAAQRTTVRLRIGTLEYVDALLGSQLIDGFAHAHPKWLVEPLDAPPEHLAFSLIHGVLDVQFAALADSTRLPERSGLRSLAVHAEPLAAMVDTKHPLAKRRRIGLADIAAERLVLFERMRAPDLFQSTLDAFTDRSLSPRVEIEVGLLQTMISAVRALRGVGLVPASLRRMPLPGIKVVPIEPSEAPRVRLALVWSQRRESPALLAFVEHVRRRRIKAGPLR